METETGESGRIVGEGGGGGEWEAMEEEARSAILESCGNWEKLKNILQHWVLETQQK